MWYGERAVWRRLHAWLAGEDGPGRPALPLGEFLHPVPLLALAALAVNDHVLKGAGVLPGWLTGKLSDFAGLLFFPLLLTAALDCVAYGVARVTGARLDFSLRGWKVTAAVVATAAVFVPLELSEAYGRFYVRTLGEIGFPSQTTRDLGDLAALVMLVPAWWLGRAEIRRVPLGRLETIARGAGGGASAALADVRARSRAPAAVDALAAACDAWLAAPADGAARDRVDAALRAVRRGGAG